MKNIIHKIRYALDREYRQQYIKSIVILNWDDTMRRMMAEIHRQIVEKQNSDYKKSEDFIKPNRFIVN